MPVGFDFVRVLQTPAFTKETLFMRLTGNLGSSLMKVFRAISAPAFLYIYIYIPFPLLMPFSAPFLALPISLTY